MNERRKKKEKNSKGGRSGMEEKVGGFFRRKERTRFVEPMRKEVVGNVKSKKQQKKIPSKYSK